MIQILSFLLTSICANVITADYRNFNDVVMKSNHVVMVEFFAPWCGHCKNLAPEYAAAAARLKGLVKLVAVDCDNKSNQELCGRFQVRGFPTLKIFSAGTKGHPQDYNGARQADAIVSTLKPMIPARYVKKVGVEGPKGLSLQDFANANSDLARVLLVTSVSTTPVLIKALSLEFLNRITFGEAKFNNKAVVDQLQTEKAPTIYIYEPGSIEPVKYNGELKQEALAKFLTKYAAPEASLSSKSVKTKKLKSKKKDLYKTFDSTIHQVKTKADLKKYCFTDFCVLLGIQGNDSPFLEVNLGFLENLKRIFVARGDKVTFAWYDQSIISDEFKKKFKVPYQNPTLMVLSQSKFSSLPKEISRASAQTLIDGFIKGNGTPYNFDIELNDVERTEL